MVDPFVPFIRETLERYPRISASRLYEMVCQRGLTPSVPVRLSPLAQRHDRPIPSHDLKDYDELGADPDPNDVAARPDLAAPKEDNDEDE
jgi:hypothetical protein